MVRTEGTMETCRNAKVTPTASASMLVASAIRERCLRSRATSHLPEPPSFFNVSIIILPPMSDSSPNAIQWSTAVM